ncbi:MAG: acyclic terpene utilization AtuA family protein, partial [Dehalococcoidia bacterium]
MSWAAETGGKGGNIKRIRIGAGAAMLGDRLDPALEMISRGNIDYIAFDNLGEVTISDLQRRRLSNPDRGYADIRRTLGVVMKPCLERGVRAITNAGGINPTAAARQAVELARRQGLEGLGVAAVTGDDTVGEETSRRIAELRGKGVSLSSLDTGEEFSLPEDRVVGMSVYLGAFPIVEALERGGRVIITGRYADAALWLAPQVY